MRRATSVVVLLALLITACGKGSDEGAASADEAARLDRALASLDDVSERVRREVLRTCDKWQKADGSGCVENEIRKDQLECWLEQGLERWGFVRKRGLGPYSRDRITMIWQNNCLIKRKWRKVHKDQEF